MGPDCAGPAIPHSCGNDTPMAYKLAVAIARRLLGRGFGTNPGTPAQSAAEQLAIISTYTSDAK
eukprot:10202398-Lingulodinium_polyedra.AAC.1